VYDAGMVTARRDTDRPRRLTSALTFALAVVAAGCAADRPRPLATQVSNALPESDPATRGTVQGPRFLSEVEQVVVRLGRDATGGVVVLQVLSPALTPEQQEEVRRAFSLGGWKRQLPLPTEAESWIETIVRNRP
jgi:hypothetical protein